MTVKEALYVLKHDRLPFSDADRLHKAHEVAIASLEALDKAIDAIENNNNHRRSGLMKNLNEQTNEELVDSWSETFDDNKEEYIVKEMARRFRAYMRQGRLPQYDTAKEI